MQNQIVATVCIFIGIKTITYTFHFQVKYMEDKVPASHSSHSSVSVSKRYVCIATYVLELT